MRLGPDFVNEFVVQYSIDPLEYSATKNGDAVDCQDCGPDVTTVFGYNPLDANECTCNVKLQESEDGSTNWTDVSGHTHTEITDETAVGEEVKTTSKRSKRYVRAVATLAGATTVLTMAVLVLCPKASY